MLTGQRLIEQLERRFHEARGTTATVTSSVINPSAPNGKLHGAGRYAVGAIRKSKTDNTLDDFPTPPWATRALCEHVIKPNGTVLEPAANRGFMARPLAEYFDSVTASDIADYGCGYPIADFLRDHDDIFDWVISNPPFNQTAPFIIRANQVARIGVAMLCKIQILETLKRREHLSEQPAEHRGTIRRARADGHGAL